MKKISVGLKPQKRVLKNPPNKDREEEDVKAEVGV
jgi:hypothetical protein